MPTLTIEYQTEAERLILSYEELLKMLASLCEQVLARGK